MQKKLYPTIVLLFLSLCCFAQQESEPNDTRPQASPLAPGKEVSGSISGEDRYDYYKTLLPGPGTVKIYVEGTHTGGYAGSFYLYLYDKSGRQIENKYLVGNVTQGGVIRDTISVTSQNADSLYFLIYQNTNRSFDYRLKYEITDIHPNDTEPNDEFPEANDFSAETETKGLIGYRNDGKRDSYDYFKTALPDNGTVQINLKGTHTGGYDGGYYLYVYDKSKRQIASQYVGRNVKQGEDFSETIRISSRAQSGDSLYFLIYQNTSRSFAYTFSYEMIEGSPNDREPNNTYETANTINAGEILEGQIGYVSDGNRDSYDYYKTLPPSPGTITVYLEGTHTGGYDGGFYFYAYDKSKRQIDNKYVGNNSLKPGESFKDTIHILSRGADSLYFSIYQNTTRSYSYKISYEVTDQFPQDPENNDDYANAIPMDERQEHRGLLGYTADGKRDSYDYYTTQLPVDGTIKLYIEGTHTGGYDGSFYFYAYDSSRRQIANKYLNGSNTSKGGRIYDTILIPSRAAENVYFSLYQNTTRSFAYSIRYEMVDTSLNDPEPNGTFPEAVPLNISNTVEGHLGYTANGTRDSYDYYVTKLPVDGTVKVYLEALHTGGYDGGFYFYAYDKSRRQIEVKTVGHTSAKPGSMFRDTILIASRAADTLYFLLYQNSTKSHQYKIRYEMDGAGINDPEPNNSFDQAVPFLITDTLGGRIGYTADGTTDNSDYYKTAVPANGLLQVYAKAKNTSFNSASFRMYVYDKNRRQIGYKNLRTADPGMEFLDTVSVNCVTSDSVYLLVYQPSQNRSFSYELRFGYTDQQPVADFSYTRTGNQFGFMEKTKNTTGFQWRMGNGVDTAVRMPFITYAPGSYDVRLIAVNTACNFRDTATQSFDVAGVEYFTPTEMGTGGDLTMQVFGGGLDTSTQVILSNGGVQFTPMEKYGSTRKEKLGLSFDLHFAPVGKYDVTIQIPGQDTLVYPEAFEVKPIEYPETWSEIIGPSIWRSGRSTAFSLKVSNKGNTTARGVIVALIWPEGFEMQFAGQEYQPPAGIRSVTLKDGSVETVQQSDLNWVYDTETATPITKYGEQDYKGFVRYLFVPGIPPHGSVEIPLQGNSQGSSKHRLITYTVKPNMFGSCETFGSKKNESEPKTIEFLISTLDMAVDKTKIVPAQVMVKGLDISQKHIDVSSEVLFHRMWAKWYGADDLTDSEYYDYYKQTNEANEFAAKKTVETLADVTLGRFVDARKTKLNGQIADRNKQVLEYVERFDRTGSKKKRRAYAQAINDAFNAKEMSVGELVRLSTLAEGLEGAKKLKYLNDLRELLKTYVDEDCPEHKEQLEYLEKMLEKEQDIIDEREKETESRTSYDPNAIYGPDGFGAGRYMNNELSQSFLIMFENVDTAKADAQFVRITDTLDKQVFDLSTFSFGSVSVGNHRFIVPDGRKQFTMERSLAPMNMRVRVNASLDTATGIAEWLFTAIDPQTGDVPLLDGFLPPNNSSPEGEGSVSYAITPKQNLPNRTEMHSRASIVFDFNEPIVTNTWTNRIDKGEPRSHITTKLEQDSVISVYFTASDGESGVGYYSLYYAEENGEWFPLGGSKGDTLRLIGEPGKTYRFTAMAHDRTGNEESKPMVAEATVEMPGSFTTIQQSFTLAPNPAYGIARVIPATYSGNATILIHSITGQELKRWNNIQLQAGTGAVLDIASFRPGMYFVSILMPNGTRRQLKLLVNKP